MDHRCRDAHTHFFSRLFFETLAGQAPAGGTIDERLAAAVARGGFELPDADALTHQMRWLGEMDEVGIESMVTFASVPEEAATVAEVATTSGGRLMGYTVVNPVAPSAPAFLESALGDLGLRGIVLFPALHGYSVADAACRPALEKAREHGAVVVVHTGLLQVPSRDHFGLPRTYDGRFANPLDVVRAAAAFPTLPFVLPHLGAGMFQEALLVGSWCENVYVDTSSSNHWLRAQVPELTLTQALGRAFDVFGTERVLYGSDSSTFPRGYRRDVLEAQVAAVAALGLSEDERTAFFHGNFERLLPRR